MHYATESYSFIWCQKAAAGAVNHWVQNGPKDQIIDTYKTKVFLLPPGLIYAKRLEPSGEPNLVRLVPEADPRARMSEAVP